MKKHLKFIPLLLLVVLISATLLPSQKAYADATADQQQGAHDVGTAQAEAAAAASDLTTVQQCAGNTQCLTSWTYAATNAANLAQQAANDATNLAKQDTGNTAISASLQTQIQANSAEAQSAATAAENSATQAATASGETTTAQQESAAAQQSAQASGASSGGAQQTSATPAATTQTTGSNFVPLTDLPGIDQVASATNLSAFFNVLYKLCIGVAATLAVLQIMYAGFLWMTSGDNMENVSKARHLISSSVFGLVLVLSPVVVFELINPCILSLQIGGTNACESTGAPAGTAAAPAAATPSTGITAADTQGVLSGSPTVSPQVQSSMQQAAGDGTCSVDCTSGNTCSQGKCVPVTSVDSTCTDYDIDGYGVLPQGQTCSTQYQDGDTTIPISCCDSSATPTPNAVCCAHPNPK